MNSKTPLSKHRFKDTNSKCMKKSFLLLISVPVIHALPKVTHLQIIGDLKEGSKVTVTANITGATESTCKVQWFKTFSSILDGENGLEAFSTSKWAKAFRIPLGAVGCYIVAKFTPVHADGESGEPAYIISDRAVETPPKVTHLQIIGDLKEGSKVTVTANITGATESTCKVQWFKKFSSILDGENGLEAFSTSKWAKAFRIPLGAVGRYIVAKFTHVHADGESGEPAYIISDRAVESK